MNDKTHHHIHLCQWGSDDQLGAANYITPEKRVAAMHSVRQGKTFDLSREIKIGVPNIKRIQPQYAMSMWINAEYGLRAQKNTPFTNECGSNIEHINMTLHTGTHIDALGHITIGDRMYNNRRTHNTLGNGGLRELGAEKIPALITRGVCIDASHLDGGDHLAAGRVITREEIKALLAQQNTTLTTGDILLIRTGWGKFFAKDNDKYLAGEPGIGEDAAEWIIAQQVSAIGSDNMAVEVLPAENSKKDMPVHQQALVEAGVYLIENLDLDELCAAQVHTFCFLLLPVKFKGATGCPVRPTAVI
ncbi:MAG TPA: cyclase [Gammaproteobacteria bacterium]|nr:cyclase [Gammaproteobacteria bacterium]